MKRAWLIFSVALCLGGSAYGHTTYEERIAESIKRHENSRRYPYGVKDGRRHTEAEARQICLNTIRHAWADWLRAGRPGDFIDFLADIYCPPSDDPIGNRNWKRNLHWFLNH